MASIYDPITLSQINSMENSGSLIGNAYGLAGSGGFHAASSWSLGAQGSAASNLVQQNFNQLSNSLGSAPTGFQQYIAYNQGVAGSQRIFNADPNALASSVIANPGGNMSGYNPATSTVGDYLNQMSTRWQKAGGQGSYTGSPPTAGAAATASPTTGGAATTGLSAEGIAGYFERAAVIILGFIFINSGLRMLGSGVPMLPADASILPPRAQRVRHMGETRTVMIESPLTAQRASQRLHTAKAEKKESAPKKEPNKTKKNASKSK